MKEFNNHNNPKVLTCKLPAENNKVLQIRYKKKPELK